MPVPDAGGTGGGGAGGGGNEPACPALTGATVAHTTDITTAETWAGEGQVHEINFGITVRPGGSLTLAPCAVVKIAPGLIVSVVGDVAMNKPAKLSSQGTALRPVTISRKDPTRAWGQLRAFNPLSTFELAHTTIEGGGDQPTVAMLMMTGSSDRTKVDPMIKADFLTLKNAAGRALALERGAAFTADSTSITVTGGGAGTSSASGDLDLTPRAAGTLPAQVKIENNALNQIRLSDQLLQIERDLTLRNHGVPYAFHFDRVRVHSETATPKLTIEAGTELQLDDYLMIGSDGSQPSSDQVGVLEVKGEPSKPVIFTTRKPTRAAGDWPGLWLRLATGSTVRHAKVQAAGGFNGVVSANCKPAASSDHAAIFIGGFDSNYIPAAGDFTGVAIENSKSHGLNAMWSAASFGPDLTAGFSFTGLQGCRQTKNQRMSGCGTEAGCLVP